MGEGEREGGRKGGKEGGREGGREEGREEGRKGGRERGRVRERKGGREGTEWEAEDRKGEKKGTCTYMYMYVPPITTTTHRRLQMVNGPLHLSVQCVLPQWVWPPHPPLHVWFHLQ